MKKQKIVAISCENCKGKLEINESAETTVCPYCESVYSTDDLLLQNGGKSRMERDIELSKHQTELETIRLQNEKEQKENTRILADKFKRGKLYKFLIFCIIISGFSIVGNFGDGNILRAFIAVVQITLYICAFLMGLQIIEEKKQGLHVVLVIAGLLLILPYSNLNDSSSSRDSEAIKWEEMPLASVIPEIEGKKGNIYSNELDSLSIDIYDIDETQYNAYMDECIEEGFIIDQKQLSGFEAFNQEGYKVQLYHYDSSEKMSVKVYKPVEVSEIMWPTSELAALIPVPLSSNGKIHFERSDAFKILLAQTTHEEYQSYVQQCSDFGFDIDYEKADNYYKASNEAGVVLRLTYQGFNMMEVSLELTKTEVQSTTAESEAVQETTAATAEGTSDWEQFLIDYEAWVDQYILLIEKYAENPTDITILSDYTSMTAEMLEWSENAENIQSELSDSDLVAYMETQVRITKKLNEAMKNIE